MKQVGSRRSPLSGKKKAGLTAVALLALALGRGIYAVQGSGPDAAIRSFSQAVKAQDYERVASLLSTPTSKWSASDAQGFVGYLADHDLQVEEVLEQLKQQKAGAKVYQDTNGNRILGLVEDGKTFFFFDHYRVSSYPVAVQVTSNLDGLTIDGQTVPKDKATNLGKVKLTNQPLSLLASTEFGRLDTNLLLPFEKGQKNQLEMNLTAVEKELSATLPGKASEYSQIKLMVNGKKVVDGLRKTLLLLEDQKLQVHASFYYMGKEFTTETKTVEVSAASDQLEVDLDLAASVKTAMKEAQVQALEEARVAASASASAAQSREKAAQAASSQSRELKERKSSSSSEAKIEVKSSSSKQEEVNVLHQVPEGLLGSWQAEQGELKLKGDGSGRLRVQNQEFLFSIGQLQDHGQGLYQIRQGNSLPDFLASDGSQVAIGFRLVGDQLEILRWNMEQGPISIEQVASYQRKLDDSQSREEESQSQSSASETASTATQASSSRTDESSANQEVESETSSLEESSSSEKRSHQEAETSTGTSQSSSLNAESSSSSSSQESERAASSLQESNSSEQKSSSDTEVGTAASSEEAARTTWTKVQSQVLADYLNSQEAGAYTSTLETVKAQLASKSMTLIEAGGQDVTEKVEILDVYDYQVSPQDPVQRYFFVRKVDGSGQVLISTDTQGSNYHVKEVSNQALLSLFVKILEK
ncbi:hypothetical protein E5983_07880 [Streptococcus danieliae]|uniref:TcaA second domain-containing protein n=1 Tax=Streptococcus danieliae TaxID=747656 RepID=A0A7X3KD37_9STRE|nr:hypothetical protein [Streptococcus danieliae]MVX59547.1 hypothetical protein [Streptococcus danieliae]